MWTRFVDWLAIRLGTWALRRIYGADCKSDVRDAYPNEFLNCPSCDAKRLIDQMNTSL